MSRRLNLGLAALVVLLALAAVVMIARQAVIPDPASCVSRRIDDLRTGAPDSRKAMKECQARR